MKNNHLLSHGLVFICILFISLTQVVGQIPDPNFDNDEIFAPNSPIPPLNCAAVSVAFSSRYNDKDSWVPSLINAPPIKHLTVNFFIFDDPSHSFNFNGNDPAHIDRLNLMFVWLNAFYNNNAPPSDPLVPPPVDRPKTYIQFDLGNPNYYFNYDNTHYNTDIRSNLRSVAGHPETLNIYIVSGYRVGVTLTYAGSVYPPNSSNIPVTVDPPTGGGTPATYKGVTDALGNLTLQPTAPGYSGFGYYSPPNIVIDPPPGAGTQATATTYLFCETGNAPYASTTLNFQEDVIMFNPRMIDNQADYAYATFMAHEIGHCLDLTHTYNGVTCGGGDTYLDDVFGSPPPGNCPHIYNWGADPTVSTTDRITNNMMSGNKDAHYFSPLQMGRMHRALALKSIRQYLNNCVYDQLNPWQVTNNETWDFDMQFDKDIIVDNNSTLEITCKLSMPNGSKIVVNPGSTLIIDGILTNNCDGA